MNQPTLCRPEAFQLFAESLSTLDSTESLLNAAVAVSMHALDDVKPEDVDIRLRALATRVVSRVYSRSPQALLAHLHNVLFDEEGFAGNQRKYYQPLNSYIPAVLESKHGLPVTLSLVYKVVGEFAGLQIEGIKAPAHFLVRVATEDGWQIIDPFLGGAALSRDEVIERIERITRSRVGDADRYLATATNGEWLARIIANLQYIFSVEDCLDDLAAMNEMQQLLQERLGNW